MKYPKEYLDEIKTRLKVSTVVSRTINLKKRGKEFVGLSPFKNEKTPSFTVNDDKEFYHCFSTGEHGNIFDFIMKTQNLKFGEAVKFLANLAGMSPYTFSKQDEEREKNWKEYSFIYNEYIKFYHDDILKNEKASAARDYLKKRNLSKEEVKKFKIGYVQKNIEIFSSDYLSKRKESEEMFQKIKKNQVDILVGTQMISKGFNFPKLNCIVVVDADFSGKGYDLRTTEKNIQLYNQLGGRAGRFSSKSIIIYQTISPSNETLRDLLQNNPEKFLENELLIRESNNLPPFKRLIAIVVSSRSKESSLIGAREIKKKIQTIENLEVLGPVDSPIFRVKKMYRTRLLLRSKNEIFIQKKLIKILDKMKISSKIKLTVDVDPINFT